MVWYAGYPILLIVNDCIMFKLFLKQGIDLSTPGRERSQTLLHTLVDVEMNPVKFAW